MSEIVSAIWARRNQEQELGYCAREFVLCGLPYRRQEGLIYERKNGHFSLRVEASPRYGLPYGEDRLIPIWLATAFQAQGCPEDNTIHVNSPGDILRALGTDKKNISGIELRLLRERFQRVFGATYYVRDTFFGEGAFREEGYRLIRRAQLGFLPKVYTIPVKTPHPNQYSAWPNQIELTADFANDLRRAAVPIDLDTVRALRQTPAALDLYVWQAWRSYRLHLAKQKGPQEIPVFGPGGLLLQLGTETQEPKKARQLLRRWQKWVKDAWTECPNSLSLDGDTLIIRPGVAVNPYAKLKLPGVKKTPPSPPLSQTPPDLVLDVEPTKEPPQEDPP